MNVGISLVACLLTLVLAAPAAAADYQPQPFQEGKDVIWLPTPNELVTKMLDLGQVTAKDVVIDLGSGDGRTVIAAAKRGASAAEKSPATRFSFVLTSCTRRDIKLTAARPRSESPPEYHRQ